MSDLKGTLKAQLRERAQKAKAPAAGNTKNGVPVKKNVQMRWVLVIGGLFAVATVLSSNTQTKTNQIVRQKSDNFVEVKPSILEVDKNPELKSQVAINALQQQLSTLTQQNKDMEEKLATLQKEQEANKNSTKGSNDFKNLPAGIVPPPSIVGPDSNGSKQGPIAADLPPPPPPVGFGGKSDPTASASSFEDVRTKKTKDSASQSDSDTASADSGKKILDSDRLAISRPGLSSRDDGVFMAPPITKDSKPATKVVSKSNNVLPEGSFAPVALLTGLEAGAGSQNQANPEPILMRIQNNAQLPGASKYQLKSCFVLGSGYGDLSSERVKIRAAQISCTNPENHLVLTASVQGYVVDSDGKLGLRGKVIDRQGVKLAQATLAGFAQGLAGAIGQTQGTVTSTAFGTANSIGGADALRASGLQGAQTATSQLAQFYLKEAASLFPVISVDSMRQGTIVFTSNTELNWSDSGPQFNSDKSK